MRKKLFFASLALIAGGTFIGCANFGNSLQYINQDLKIEKVSRIIYLNPEIIPDLESLEVPTYQAFFSAAEDKTRSFGDISIKRIDTPMPYDNIDVPALISLCTKNNSDLVVVPRVKYFKVGIGRYVFSNQVVVSLKIYDKNGNFVIEVGYDTYAGNARIIGSAENSVKIGTNGAIQKAYKELRKRKMIDVL